LRRGTRLSMSPMRRPSRLRADSVSKSVTNSWTSQPWLATRLRLRVELTEQQPLRLSSVTMCGWPLIRSRSHVARAERWPVIML